MQHPHLASISYLASWGDVYLFSSIYIRVSVDSSPTFFYFFVLFHLLSFFCYPFLGDRPLFFCLLFPPHGGLGFFPFYNKIPKINNNYKIVGL